MGQTLIIRGADFSDIAIGTVEVPIDLADETLAWITASGNNSFTDAQKIAIDDFITAIGFGEEGSIYSKIDRMWLPMIAADKAHSLVDYKIKATHNLLPATSSVFENYVTFANHGLKGNYDGNSYVPAPVIDDSLEINSQNFSMFVLNTVAFAAQVLEYGGMGSYDDINTPTTQTNPKSFFALSSTASSCLYYLNSALQVAGRQQSGNKYAPCLRGVISTADYVKFIGTTNTLVNSETGILTNDTYKGIRILNNYYKLVNSDVPYGAFIVAKALSDTEAKTLRDAVNALFASIIS